MLKNRRPVIAVILVAILLGGGGFWLWRAPSETGNVLTLYGNIDIREVQPAFNDSGRIASVSVHEGVAVKRGQLLATLDDSRYAAALAQARAQMQARKQTLERLQAGSRPEEIAEAKAKMDALEAAHRNAEIVYKRYANLTVRNAASRQQLDDARAAAAVAFHQYEAAKQTYLLVKMGPRQEDIAAARADYEAAVAAFDLAQHAQNDTRLFAPADGIVQARILEPGDMAFPNAPVVTLALTDPLWVRTYVPETSLGRVRPGMAARVATDSYPGKTYRGWIGYLSPTAEFTPKTVQTPELRAALVYQLRVFLCDAHGELRLGMPATVRIDLDQPAPESGPDGRPADAVCQ